MSTEPVAIDPEARAAGDRPQRMTDLTATSPESIALSKDLKRRGWRFVGPTTVYAFMQAMGLVNDHVDRCAVRRACEEARTRFARPRRGS